MRRNRTGRDGAGGALSSGEDNGRGRFPDPGGGACDGFTLIELLVVIVILAVLAGVLLPTLSRAKDQARATQCLGHLRQWGLAALLYASDNDDFLPHPDDRRRDRGAFGSPTFPEHDHGWVDVLPPYLGGRAWRDFPEGQKPASGIWHCPTARPLADPEYDYRPSVEGYHSYAMNSFLAHDFLYGLPWGAELQPSFLKLTRAAAPSQTILLFEQTLDPRQGYGQAGSFRLAGYQSAEDARAAAERHARRRDGLGGNVLHLDGHVRWRNDLWDQSRPNPRIPRRGDFTWFPYPY
ncbi:MAG: type II secretion system protein [Verrucomicrobia bacterium]|jgi:prepilin-type N-terminal cleavage/methylation domain-containing protein/prepilin-type processing-associated H-X9-DG protein|nr:type II secretion system protein [Verrucomicrobiota bacterium]